MIEKSIDLKVLIVYQGDSSSEFRKHIVEIITEYNQKVDNANITPMLFKGGGDSFESATYKHLRKYIISCDAAIAIVSSDKRYSSSAGNLWFEMGLWCGINLEKNLLVLVQEQPSNYDEQTNGKFPVDAPSNIVGQTAPRFKTKKGIDGPVNRFIGNKLADKLKSIAKKTAPFTCKDKIISTIARAYSVDDIENFYKCPNDDQYCTDNKFELYCTISELMRMENCNGEHGIIQHGISKIENLLDRIITLGVEYGAHGPKGNQEFRRQSIMLIANNLYSSLIEFSDNLRNLVVRESYDDKLDAWGRFKMFCVYRIQVAAKLFNHNHNLIKGVELQKTYRGIDSFVLWANDYLREKHKYIDPLLKLVLPKRDENLEKLQDIKDFVSGLYHILDVIYSENFLMYFASFKENDTVIDNVQDLPGELEKIRNNFPQSCPHFPNIWPRTETEKNTDQDILEGYRK
jgi:hypothetical protein